LLVQQLAAGAQPQPVGTIATSICRVRAVFAPANFFEVWLPTTTWNGKYQGEGNGGLAGSITYSDMRTAISRGYASSSTDTGHASNAASDPWWRNAQQIKDYGYNSIHVTAGHSRAIIEAYYGQSPDHSYFVACSTGGREAFMEAQRFPQDYDGIVAGSPVYRVIKLRSRHVWTWQCNHQDRSEAHAIPSSKLRPIFDAIISQCDYIDGLIDGQVDDPRRCDFQPASVKCTGADDGSCLTAEQVETLECMAQGPIDSNTDEQIYPGPPWTSELDEAQNIGLAPNTQYTTFFANTVFEDAAYDFHTFRFPDDVYYSMNKVYGGETLEQIHHAESPDLSAFHDRGGKFIIWHGCRIRCRWPPTPSPTTRTCRSSSTTTITARGSTWKTSRACSCCPTWVTAAAALRAARTLGIQ